MKFFCCELGLRVASIHNVCIQSPVVLSSLFVNENSFYFTGAWNICLLFWNMFCYIHGSGCKNRNPCEPVCLDSLFSPAKLFFRCRYCFKRIIFKKGPYINSCFGGSEWNLTFILLSFVVIVLLIHPSLFQLYTVCICLRLAGVVSRFFQKNLSGFIFP